MERRRIIEILEAYRPGEDLETDPEVRQAMELAAQDPQLSELRREVQAFDEAFGAQLSSIAVPANLQNSILEAAKARSLSEPDIRQAQLGKVIQWFHPASFAAAAAIIILLALSFTFWNRPEQRGPSLAGTNLELFETAHSLYSSFRPSFKPRKGDDVRQYLLSNGGSIPVNLPGDIAFDDSFACDVVEVDGNKVSIICFIAPDNSKSMHLFTFKRSAFPDYSASLAPQIEQDGESCCATWVDNDQIHVLYSDKGENNLRRVLDI